MGIKPNPPLQEKAVVLGAHRPRLLVTSRGSTSTRRESRFVLEMMQRCRCRRVDQYSGFRSCIAVGAWRRHGFQMLRFHQNVHMLYSRSVLGEILQNRWDL